MKNIITKAIGAKENIDVSVEEYALEEQDLFLLCSDGLHGMVPEARLSEIVKSSTGSLERLVRQLIDAANQAGGKDNVTALAVRYLR